MLSFVMPATLIRPELTMYIEYLSRNASTCSGVNPENENIPLWCAINEKSRRTPFVSRVSTNRVRMLLMRSRMAFTSPSHCARKVGVVEDCCDCLCAVRWRVGIICADADFDVAHRFFNGGGVFSDEGQCARALAVEAKVFGEGTGDEEFATGSAERLESDGVFSKAIAQALIGKIYEWDDAAVCDDIGYLRPLFGGGINACGVVATSV